MMGCRYKWVALCHDDNLVLHVKESLVHPLLGERELPEHVSLSSL